ncbi:MAG: beta-ketoacyl-ACP reductase [Betaproteobacteria bacterium]
MPTLDPSLWGKRALVTGASRGIGQAIAVALAQAGVRVFGTATSEAGAHQITKTLREAIDQARADFEPLAHVSNRSAFAGLYDALEQSSEQSLGLVLDVSQSQASEDLLEKLHSEGGIHILVNNAGITRDNLAMRMKADEWQQVIDTNLSACFRLCQSVMRFMMKQRWGRIINITSVVGETGNPGQANYAAAKAGLAGMSRALARELGSRQITVNCVAPGFIETDMTLALSEQQRSELQQQIPLQRLGSPTDIAAAVLFLAGQSGAYVTGESLQVNGGMFMD